MRVAFFSLIFIALISQFSVGAQDPSPKTKSLSARQDTVRAVTNLFHRKRKGTRLKAAVISVIVDVLVIRMWTHPHELPQGGQAIGAPVLAGGSSVPVSRYIAVGVASAVIVEIVAQRSFGQKRLNSLLDDYKKGSPIPPRIKSKLTPKDFD